MTKKTISLATKLTATLVAFAAILVIQPSIATTQETSHPANAGFSFAVYGDSRSMMYLPYKSDQEADARRLMVEMFELVLSRKAAEAVVKKHVKLTYDPASHELVQMVMPFMTPSEVTTLMMHKGWVTEASVEDIKLLPGVHRTMYLSQGGDWVAREIVNEVMSGRAKFVLSTGTWSGVGCRGPRPPTTRTGSW